MHTGSRLSAEEVLGYGAEIVIVVTDDGAAAAAFRELEQPFSLAVVLLEHAEASGDPSEAAPLLEEASGTFERLGARPWLERAHAAQGSGAVV